MKTASVHFKTQNTPLQEYQARINKQRNWLKSFYSNSFLQAPSKVHVVFTLITWAVGALLLFFIPDAEAPVYIYAFFVAATITALGVCFNYARNGRNQ